MSRKKRRPQQAAIVSTSRLKLWRRPRRAVILGAAVILALTAGLVIAMYTAKAAPDALNFEVRDAKGGSVQLSDFHGQAVAVNFWATWCGPCRREIPGFLKVYKQYRDQGLEIVGVSLDRGGPEAVESFAKKYNIDYPVVMATPEVLKYYTQFDSLSGIPTTFFIDRQGKIASWHVGYMDDKRFEAAIKPLLEGGS